MKSLAEKYVTTRAAVDGRLRWYWQKKGCPLIRLPDDADERAVEATRLNSGTHPATQPQRFGYWYDFWLAAKRRAQSRRVAFDLSFDQFAAIAKASKGRCAISGKTFRTDDDGRVGIGNPFQPSIDRIDPSRGYTDGNCRLVCLAVNIGVNKWGAEVYRELARCTVENSPRA